METREFIKGGSDDKSKRIESVVVVPRKREGHTKLLRRPCYPAWNVFDAPIPFSVGQDPSSLAVNALHINSPFLESSTFAVYCGYANGFISFFSGTVEAPDPFATPQTIAAMDDAALKNQPQNKVTLQLVDTRASMRDGSTSSSPQIAAEWRLSPPRLFALSDGEVVVMHGENLDHVEGYFDVPSMSSNVLLMAHAKAGDTPLLALLTKKQVNILVLSEHRAAVQPSASGQPLVVADGVLSLELTTFTVIVGTRRDITIYCIRTNQPLDTLNLEKNVPLQMRSNIHGTVLIRQTLTTVLALSVGDGREASFEKARKFELPVSLGPGPQNRGEDQLVDFTIADPFFTIYTQAGKLLTKSLYMSSALGDDEEDQQPSSTPASPASPAARNINSNSSTSSALASLFDMPPLQCFDAKLLASCGSIVICVSTSNDIQVVVQSSAAMQAYSLIGIGAISKAVPHYICSAGPVEAMTEEEEAKVSETVAALHLAAAKRACRTGQHADAWGHFQEAKCSVQQVLKEVPMLTQTDKPPSSGLLGGALKLVELLLHLLRRAQRDEDEEDIRAFNWALLIVLTSDVAVNPPLSRQEREKYLVDLLAPPGRFLPALDAAQQRLSAGQRFISAECLTTCRTFLLFANEEAQEALEVCRERKSVVDAGLCLIAVMEQYANGDPNDLADLFLQQLPWMVAADAQQACKSLRAVKKSVVWEGPVVDAVSQVFIGYPLERCKMLQYFVNPGGATLSATSVSLQRLHTQYASAMILVVKCLKLMSGTGSHTVDVAPGHETGLLGVWRSELLKHLRVSNYYDTDMALMELNTAVDAHSFVGLASKTEHLPLRFRVLRFYAKYNPDKIDSVDDSLASQNLKGLSDSEVMSRLIAKYGPEPTLDEEVLLDVADAAIKGTLYGSNMISGISSVSFSAGGGGGVGVKKSASSGEDLSGAIHAGGAFSVRHQHQNKLPHDGGTTPTTSTGGGGAPRAPLAPALHHETATVHSKRNDDSAALHTLLYEMNDVDAALTFCLETTGGSATAGDLQNQQQQQQLTKSDEFAGGKLSNPSSAFFYGSGEATSPLLSHIGAAGGFSPVSLQHSTSHHGSPSGDYDARVGSSSSLGSPELGGDNNHHHQQQHRQHHQQQIHGSRDDDDLIRGGGNVTATTTTTTRSGRMLTLLVQKLLRPPPGFERKLDEAVAILSRHAENLDAEAVLSVVPADVPYTRFAPYLSRHFEQSAHRKHHLTVRAQLLSSEHFRLQQQLFRLQNRAVLVDEERMCSVCGKRLGDVMVVVYPNMKVVHFRCAKDRTKDPVTQLPFFQTVM